MELSTSFYSPGGVQEYLQTPKNLQILKAGLDEQVKAYHSQKENYRGGPKADKKYIKQIWPEFRC
jgi:hypothetical protein